MRIAILGAGSWASAVGDLLADRNEVIFYARNPEVCEEINASGTNRRYLQGFRFQNPVQAVTDPNQAVSGAAWILLGVPTQSCRCVLQKLNPAKVTAPIVNLAKGLEKSSGKRLSEVVAEFFPNPYAVLSGPSHAEDVVQRDPTTVVVAGKDETLTRALQTLFMRPYFRVYRGDDVTGVELGGAVKNIFALGIGMADGLGYGDNAKAALVTRGLHELVRFGQARGGRARTLYGLAGFGDLYVTATSLHSRNRNAGELLGRGYTLKETQIQIGQVIEGVMTCEAVHAIAQRESIEMPITEAIYQILHRELSVKTAVEQLMLREGKSEFGTE